MERNGTTGAPCSPAFLRRKIVLIEIIAALGVEAHQVFNPGTWKAETGGPLCAQGQPELLRERKKKGLSQENGEPETSLGCREIPVS